jgi:anti-anti-sigma regulatory factor
MGIQDWSDDIVLADLPKEPGMADEIKTVSEIVRDRGNCDVVMDFSAVDIITSSSLSKLLRLRKLLADCGTSSSLSKLLRLRKLLADCGHRLVFCNVAAATKGIFTVTGLDGVFELADDKFVALASLQIVA